MTKTGKITLAILIVAACARLVYLENQIRYLKMTHETITEFLRHELDFSNASIDRANEKLSAIWIETGFNDPNEIGRLVRLGRLAEQGQPTKFDLPPSSR